jgi:hypothetical protein
VEIYASQGAPSVSTTPAVNTIGLVRIHLDRIEFKPSIPFKINTDDIRVNEVHDKGAYYKISQCSTTIQPKTLTENIFCNHSTSSLGQIFLKLPICGCFSF